MNAFTWATPFRREFDADCSYLQRGQPVRKRYGFFGFGGDTQHYAYLLHGEVMCAKVSKRTSAT